MINITDKIQCCGCAACVQACPIKCISLIEDEMGFLYPSVENEMCVNCGLCEKVCPILNKWESKKTQDIIACKNKDENKRYASSSGGIFVLIGEMVINNGGVVFGACFDGDWSVIHSYTDINEGLVKFQGSKYVQSRIEDTYCQVDEFLKAGRKVLFSGTPCQIAGLKHYLRKEYDNLLTLEVLCHGVPSPRVWRDYLDFIIRKKKTNEGDNMVLSTLKKQYLIEGISFRNKQNGWSNYDFVINYTIGHSGAEDSIISPINVQKEIREDHKQNLFMKCFLYNLCLRPSCFQCPAKGGRSRADISLGDFWTINKYCADFNDDKGTTLVYINSTKGKKTIDLIDCEMVKLDNNVQYNRMYSECVKEVYPIVDFWREYEMKGISCVSRIAKSLQMPFYIRIIERIKRVFLN